MKIDSNKKKILFIVGGVLLIAILLLVGAKVVFNNDEEKTKTQPVEQKEVDKNVQIVDMTSNQRSYAVMINNNKAAWPQSGLQEAYMVYEIMVEGGITRMMALYTMDADVSKIGSVRSSRHNYLDYVLENDAIYIHWGGSEPAYADLKELGLARIDGMVYGGNYFETDSSLGRSLEHTRFTSSELIKKGIEKLELRTTTDKGYLLNYTADEVNLAEKEGSQKADNVSIKYSSYQTSSYEYNEEEKVYYRSMGGQKHVDLVTGEQYTFKNIIAYDVEYKTLSDGKLQDLQNIGSGEGVYITNGYSIPIKWSKESRSSQTKYTYLDGTEIDVSDGNTFIQIYPTSGSLTIK